jgi:hypothetical protein
MSHNINTYRDHAPTGLAEALDNPVLSVEDSSGNRARILFKHHRSSGASGPGVVLNPWPTVSAEEGFPGGPIVTIEGEDLYALRALLQELPEEAFVEPAPSVLAQPRWTKGDLWRHNPTGHLYIRGEVEWRALTPVSSVAAGYRWTDEEMDAFVLHPDNVVLREAKAGIGV